MLTWKYTTNQCWLPNNKLGLPTQERMSNGRHFVQSPFNPSCFGWGEWSFSIGKVGRCWRGRGWLGTTALREFTFAFRVHIHHSITEKVKLPNYFQWNNELMIEGFTHPHGPHQSPLLFPKPKRAWKPPNKVLHFYYKAILMPPLLNSQFYVYIHEIIILDWFLDINFAKCFFPM